MKGFLTSFVAIFLNLLIFLFLSLYFYGHDISDYLVAKSIPKYPLAAKYNVSASSGFPDGYPGGDISFETTDNALRVIDFYKNKLTRNGWELVSYGDPQPSNTYPIINYEARFRKRIGLEKFNIVINKSEPQIGKNAINTEDVTIFIHRLKIQ